MLNRGFTLIELLITICVLSILLIFAAPSFSSLFESSPMKTAQDELMGFVIMAKSEAVFRNTPVYLHLRDLNDSDPMKRCMVLSLSNTISDCTTNVVSVLSGRTFEGITLAQSYPENTIEINHVSGWPKLQSGTQDSEGYSEIGKFYVDESKKLVLKMHITGRTQVCGDGEALYGVQACGQ
tara:strand:- start:52 stop:594 length:543 start_codon:yes stop_codon:yes gene_type:complete